MATFADILLVFQTHMNFENLRADMRANASAYIAATANRTVQQIATVITADAAQYQIRLGWALRIRTTPALWASAQVGLAALSLTATEAQDIYNELKAAANFQQAAVITSAADITSMGNSILSMVAAHDRVF
jgi:hypothetical protein